MTFPRTYDADFYPILNSDTPLVVSINQIPHSFPPHRHEVLEISLVTKGRGNERVNGITHEMEPGTVTLIMPHQFHEIRNTGCEPLILYNCMFSIDLLLSAFPTRTRQLANTLLSYTSSEPLAFQLNEQNRKKMEGMFRELLFEFSHDSSFRTEMLTTKLNELVIFFIRHSQNRLSGKPDVAAPFSNRKGLAGQILFYLHAHYREQLTLEQIAADFYISRSHLSAILRETTGKTFTQLIHEFRIRHACSLLSATDMKISDVATESGFSSLQTFFRVFRHMKNMSPNEYRNRGNDRCIETGKTCYNSDNEGGMACG